MWLLSPARSVEVGKRRNTQIDTRIDSYIFRPLVDSMRSTIEASSSLPDVEASPSTSIWSFWSSYNFPIHDGFWRVPPRRRPIIRPCHGKVVRPRSVVRVKERPWATLPAIRSPNLLRCLVMLLVLRELCRRNLLLLLSTAIAAASSASASPTVVPSGF